MTQDEIIQMAQEAGCSTACEGYETSFNPDELQIFAALCYAAGQRDMKERAKEACLRKQTHRNTAPDSYFDTAYRECGGAINQLEIREPS